MERKLVTDRAQYLRATFAKETKAFKSAKEAEKQRVIAEAYYGVRYERKGNKLVKGVVDKSLVQKSSEYKRLKRALRTKSNAARGEKAKALVELGRRESFFLFPVGESNQRRKPQLQRR